MNISTITWPAIALAFLLGFVFARWIARRARSGKKQKVNTEYFKGLNFLLNEEPDKAIEVFIKALEVDSETVELHLALGGLFRRKGEVDRATRIHQNLIARPSLTDEQRLQAIYELAQDYYKAGLLDRAENLFLELKESISYREQAIDGLCSIYQQEKEWRKAIDVSRLRKRSERHMHATQMAHYWCELAEIAITQKEYSEAKKYLRSALNEDRFAARAILLRGELAFQQKNYAVAISHWQTLAKGKPALAELVVDKMIASYEALDDASSLKDYLINGAFIPKNKNAFEVWQKSLDNMLGEEAAIQHIFTQVQHEGLSASVAGYLLDNAEKFTKNITYRKALLKDLLSRANKRKIAYNCEGCGFETRAMYWHCQNCGEWESFK